MYFRRRISAHLRRWTGPKSSEYSYCGCRDDRIYGLYSLGFLNVRVSTIRRPPVRAAFISSHLDSLASKYSLDFGLEYETNA